MRQTPTSALRRDRLLLAALSLLLAAVLSGSGVLLRLDLLVQDLAQRLQAPRQVDDVVLVTIDAGSLARHGRWPWSRSVQAELLGRLDAAGARAIGWNIVLAEVEAEDDDARLMQALRDAGRVVLPLVRETAPAGTPPEVRRNGILPAFAEAAAGVGWAQAEAQTDGVVRTLRLLAAVNDGPAVLPHLVQRLAEVGRATRADLPDATPDSTPQLVRFVTGPQPFAQLSAAEVLAPGFDARRVAGKWVLVGVTAAGLGGEVVTPLADRPVAGLFFLAHALDSHLRGRLRAPPAPLDQALACVLLAGLPWLVLPRLSATAGFLGCLGAAACVLMLPVVGLLWLDRVLHTAPAAVCIALAYPLWAWRRLVLATWYLERERQGMHERYPVVAEASAADAPAPHRTHDLLAQQMAQVDALRLALRQHERDERELAEFISHDVRAPLAHALNQLTPLLGADHPACRQVARARDWLDDHLHTSRAQAMRADALQPLDLVALLHQAADELYAVVQGQGRRLERRLPDRVVWVDGQFDLLLRAVLNLLGNALRHAPEGSAIVLTLSERGPLARITVEDSGPGFTTDEQDHLFERYGRRPLGRSSDGGVGLGLYFVKTVVTRHGGRVDARCGGGHTVFGIELPVATGAGLSLHEPLTP